MEPATTAQLITVTGTLGGVMLMLTLAASAYLERRRAKDTRDLEAVRIKAEHAKWLRDERLNAYAALSAAGEEALHFIRNELPPIIHEDDPTRVDETESLWRDLRTELRKAYNRVSIVGEADPITTGREIWRVARHGANEFFRALRATPVDAGDQPDLHTHVIAVVTQLANIGDRFADASRKDLQS